MTSIAAPVVPAEVATELRTRRESGETIAELRKAFPSLSAATIRKAVSEPSITKPKAKPPVTTKRVHPQEPDYSKLPEAKREAARAAYEKAIAAFEGKPPAKGRAKPQPKAPAKSTAEKAPKAKAERKPRATLAPPNGFRGWDDPKLAARVLREKAKGSTIKQISEGLGVPAEERYWHRVSLVFRAAADAKGIERPRLSAEVIEARKARASA